jgi:Restriction endonuclease fold toxin 9
MVAALSGGPGNAPDGRGGIDELLVQFDRNNADGSGGSNGGGGSGGSSGEGRNPWWILQDEGGDIAAMCDLNGPSLVPTGSPPGTPAQPTARTVAQWTFDAYGECLSADSLHSHPHLHAGHKGPFLDRLDEGVIDWVTGLETPRLAVDGRSLYYNRNRSYSPSLGRFMQADPNANGQTLMDQMLRHGQRVMASVDEFGLEDRCVDGLSMYQYVRSSPSTSSDPLGLYSAEDGVEDAMDFMGMFDPLPGPADFIRGMLNAMITDYAENLMWDVEWAGDWSLSDDDHSRGDNSWVDMAIGRGLRSAFDIDLPFTDQTYNPLDHFASDKKPAKQPTGGGKKSGGDTKFTRMGRDQHDRFKAEMKRSGCAIEFNTGRGRADAIDFQNRVIYELKPNTPSGRTAGRKQLKKYREDMLDYKGPNQSLRGEYRCELILYTR